MPTRERRGSGLLPCCPLFPCSVAGCSRARPPAALARAPSLYRPSLALSAVCPSFCHSLAPSSVLQFDTPFRAEERIEEGRRSFTALLAAASRPLLSSHVRHVGALHYARGLFRSFSGRPGPALSPSSPNLSFLPSLAAIGKRPAAMRPRRGVLAPSSAGGDVCFTTRQDNS